MLRFNAMRVMRLRGIENPWSFMVRNGFHRSTANNFFNGKVLQIKVEHLEKLCLLLNCVPGDLFEWKADSNRTISENHALNAINRADAPPPIVQIIKDVPLEKLEQLNRELLDRKDEM